jgi:hypothetical protein
MPLPIDLSLLFLGATSLGLVAAMFIGQAVGGALGALLELGAAGAGHEPH